MVRPVSNPPLRRHGQVGGTIFDSRGETRTKETYIFFLNSVSVSALRRNRQSLKDMDTTHYQRAERNSREREEQDVCFIEHG